MTNLVEKALLIGFGIFLMIIFLNLITPLIQKLQLYFLILPKRFNNFHHIFKIINKIPL